MLAYKNDTKVTRSRIDSFLTKNQQFSRFFKNNEMEALINFR